MGDLQSSLDRLNAEQAEAVAHLDGPLLVIAGPGTGKTQLLSLRAANILANRDVAAHNILCLTYTDAGARAMRKRLVELIGKDAFGIEVSTFHSFAASVKTRFPEYFHGNPGAVPVSSLHGQEIVDGILKGLPYGSPLSGVNQGVAAGLRDCMGFISTMKRQGIEPDTFRAIMEQNLAAADYLERAGIFALFDTPLSRKRAEKEDFIAVFEERLAGVCAAAPDALRRRVVSTPGIYVPYVVWLARTLADTELISESGKTEGFQSLRGRIAKKDRESGRYVPVVREVSEKGIVAANAFEAYREQLEAEGLIDFDDMVMDTIAAIADNPELRYALQERYRYIQVDEFQDTNGAQMRIVELLCEGIDEPNVMAVGDDDQAIMRFQGASIACIGQFCDLYHPHNVVLKTNYRSTPHIVSLGTDVARQIENRLSQSADGKAIEAFRPAGVQASFEEDVFANDELQLLALARDIRARIDAGFVASAKDPDEAIAVISPKHASLKRLIPYLRAENIPFAYKVTAEVFAMESLQTMLALIRFTAAYAAGREELAAAYLPQIIAAPELGGASFSAVRFALFARAEHRGRWMRALRETDDERIAELGGRLVRWAQDAPGTPLRVMLSRIGDSVSGYYRARAERDPLAFAEFNGGMRALANFAEEEARNAAACGRTLRLADLVERLDRARLFGVQINASIGLSAPGAVQLTSAHSSKGLEYDLVYLLDSDDTSWHKGGSSSKLYASNMLFDSEKDDDDIRRLLFVAVTRAKSELKIYRTGDMGVRELQGRIGTVVHPPVPADVATAIGISWEQCYDLSTPELAELLLGAKLPDYLSASALNRFVAYDEANPGAMEYEKRQFLDLPEEPSIHLEFGTIVHAYLDDYVHRCIHALPDEAERIAAELAAEYRDLVETMDFPEDDRAPFVKRFDRVCAAFGPWAAERMGGRMETELGLCSGIVCADGTVVPLFGKCDLLLVDDAAKTVRVVDYKTGKFDPKKTSNRAYRRQLAFYRLLVENASEFAGYRVVACENWYVEPEAGKGGGMNAPVDAPIDDHTMERLSRLIAASWHRICARDFDRGPFEESAEKEAALARIEYAGRKVYSTERREILQEAFEDWLVACDGGAR